MSVPQPPPLPSIIGHRGAAGHAPENTLASIRTAATLGAAWVEFDAMLTGDGEIVLIHDERVDRTTDGNGRVAAMDLAVLRRLDAGSWFDPKFAGERIPTLGEAAALLADLGLGANVEIKPASGHERATGRAVGEFLANEWPEGLLAPILSSFSEEALDAARLAAPNVPRGLLVGRVPADWRGRLERLGCAGIHCAQKQLRPDQAEAILTAGIRLLAYTVNDADRARTLLGWGVEAVFTDYPDRLRDI